MEGMRGRCVVRPPRHAVQSPLGARSVPGLGRHRPSRAPSRPTTSPGGSVRPPAGLTDIRAAVFRCWHWRTPPVPNRYAAPGPEENMVPNSFRPSHPREKDPQPKGKGEKERARYHLSSSVCTMSACRLASPTAPRAGLGAAPTGDTRHRETRHAHAGAEKKAGETKTETDGRVSSSHTHRGRGVRQRAAGDTVSRSRCHAI
jgi:hypothetical protein